MARLPTVKLRHKVSGKSLIVNAEEYARKIGAYARRYYMVEYRGGNASDSIVEHAVRQAEIEWEKTRSGKDDRKEQRFEQQHSSIQNIRLPQDDDPNSTVNAPSEHDATTSGEGVQPSSEPYPPAATAPRKRGRPAKI